MKYFIVPGIGNSESEHWQTHIENVLPQTYRITQDNWLQPDCEKWINKIDSVLNNEDLSKVVLIGHSLGSIAIVKWSVLYKKSVKSAILVAPADIEQTISEVNLKSFLPIPLEHIKFKTLLITSSNDTWIKSDRAIMFAKKWGSDYINIGNAGHINVSSGFGYWDDIFTYIKILSE